MTASPTVALRDATPEDSQAICDLVNASSQQLHGTRRCVIDEHGRLRFGRSVPPFAERAVATLADGTLIGFGYLISRDPYIVHEIGWSVHPDYADQGIDALLLRWAEGRARLRLDEAPAGARVVAQAMFLETDQDAHQLLLNSDYRDVRQWIHLELTMEQEPPAPEPIDGITIRQMDQRREWGPVGTALGEAFADHWGELPPAPEEPEEDAGQDDAEDAGWDDPYFNSRDVCFVAWDGARVAGSCLGDRRTVEWPESGKLGSLSIRREYRRRGIGRALVRHQLAAFYRQGIRRVITDTDSQSFTGSYHLYMGEGMRIYRRENVWEKALRPGTELRAMSEQDLQ